MEDKNILWGELVGGLLIVGCSIALVLTLWRSLESLPYFPFLLSTAITAALFGAGQYTLHHWKLTSTSRGLLVIALLLTPLNLLLLVVPGTNATIGWLDIGVKLAAVCVFTGIVRASGRDLIGTDLLPGPVNRRWLLALAVVGAPASQAIAVGEWTFLSFWLPLICHTSACGAVLGGLTWYRRKRDIEPLGERQTSALLMFVGIALFALFAAWGMLLTRTPSVNALLGLLALPLVIASVPLLEAGLLVQRRLIAGHAGLRATGTGVALVGSGLIVSGIVLAWPDPLWVTLVAAVVGVLFTRISWRESLPLFQIFALPALALACVLGIHGAAGQWVAPTGTTASDWLRHLLVASNSGMILTVFALFLAAVAEFAIRIGSRPQGIAYALSAVASGLVGLLITNWYGQAEPWIAIGVHLACAFGLLTANVRWRYLVATQAGVWLVLLSTVWALWASHWEDRGSWGIVIALEAFALASLASVLKSQALGPGAAGIVYRQLRIACRDVAAAACLLSVVFAFFSTGFPEGSLHTVTAFTLAITSLLLTRIYKQPVLAWVGSAFGFFALLHLCASTAQMRPITSAILIAVLAHSTLATLLASAFGRWKKYVRLFAESFRQSARVTSCLAVPLLFFPTAGYAFEWAGFAAWLAILWFGMMWIWNEKGTFSAAQAALSLAAVLTGLAWVERQPWWGTTSLGLFDPRVLQSFGIALASLALVWTAVRRWLPLSRRLSDPLSFDRLMTAAVLGGQLTLLIIAVASPVRAELHPSIYPYRTLAPAELTHAFGTGSWLLIGMLGTALVASLRLRTEAQPNGDNTLLGLALLGVSIPLIWAGTFEPEIAAASALRWSLAITFVVGTLILYFREPLANHAAKLGFKLRVTSFASSWAYGVFAVAAGVTILLTINLAYLGFGGLKPRGPLESSIFARMGWTISSVVPMGFVVFGLAIAAVRERLAGYAFAAGLVFTTTMAGGYALGVVTSGGTLGVLELVRLGMIAAGSAAVWALLWLAGERRVPGGLLLTAQSVFGLAGIGVLAVVPMLISFIIPEKPLPASFAGLGQSGWLLLTLACGAAFERARRVEPSYRGHVLGFAGIVAGVLAACAVQPFDEPGRWISFFTMAVVWGIAGAVMTAAMLRIPQQALGIWFNVVTIGLVFVAIRSLGLPIGYWFGPLALAGYSMVIAWISALPAIRNLEIEHESQNPWKWLLSAEYIVAAVAAIMALFVSVSGPIVERFAGPLAFVLLAITSGLLAAKAPLAMVQHLRFTAVVLAVLGVSLVGWAIPEPEVNSVWLHRNGWAFIALVASTLICLELLPKWLASAWATESRRVGAGTFIGALIWLCIVILQQIPVFNPLTKHTPLELPAVLAILAGVATLIVLAIRFALRPAADPFGLPVQRRTSYVYLAEVLLVLFFVHIRFNLPELFLAQAVQFWTFLVMLLAFIGVGFAEYFQGKGLAVLAIPLRRTGLLLPLIPLIAFWAKPPAALIGFADSSAPGLRPLLGYLEKLPQHFDSYAGLWFLAGLLYGFIALRRQSFGWALIAALSANAGMWAMLAHNHVSAAVHPQVWVIPLSLIILVSEHINRRELRREVSTGLRYLGIGMLYLSSAADMFIAGAGESLWLPVILAVFCVAGMFAGIMLRVRAFLFLGIGFLLLDVFAMVWHAAVDRDQTWVWYVSGIVLGTAILAIFALFEKRKNDVHNVVDRLRRWD